jgi:hypothetical protein
MRRLSRLCTCAAGALLLGASAARAATVISVEQGPTSAGDTDNILFHGQGTVDQGLTVTGRANQGDLLFDVVSNDSTELLVATANGQAVVKALDGGTFTSVTLQGNEPGFGFAKIAFSLSFEVDGQVTITATEADGDFVSETFDGDKNLEKFFALASDSGLLTSITISGDAQIDEIKHIRVGGIQAAGEPGGGGVPVIPLPAAAWSGMAMLGALGVAKWARRRCKPA